MSSDSSAAVPTEVPEVQGEKPSVGPPPYNEFTVMEGDGVYCYKCHNYRTNSWSKLYTHLRLRCLDTHEKAVLANSYLHVQSNKELRQRAQAKRASREPLAIPPVVSESETQPTPPTGPDTLPDGVPQVPTSTPDVLPAAVLQQQSDSAESTPGALPAASAQTESPWSTPGALPRVLVTEEPSARDAIVMPPPATGGPVAVTAPPPSDVTVSQDGTCWTRTQACYM